MVIAWTYLLHAYYRGKNVEYRYYRQGPKRRVFDRTKRGAYKHWGLERCLNDSRSPLDRDTANNLRFLIGLRHEIEDQVTKPLDAYRSGRYQAYALNCNEFVKKLFGRRLGIDQQLSYSIQFMELTEEKVAGPGPEASIPERLRAFVAEFDGALSREEYNSLRYSYRLLSWRKLVNRPGQADRVVEFIDPNSDLARTMDSEYWVKKEVEKPKYRPTDVVRAVEASGFGRFRVTPEHSNMWKREDAKNPGKGFGVEVQGAWYWYQSWVDRRIELCQAAGDRYR